MTNHTEFNNKVIHPSTRDILKILQKKFGSKTPISVSGKRDGTIKKIEIGKNLTIAEKNWVMDKFPELE